MATSSIRPINPLDAWVVNTNREPVGVALWRNRAPVMFTASGGGGGNVSLYGNTVGAASTISGAGLYLQGGDNVTLSNNAGTVVVSAGAGGGGAGTGFTSTTTAGTAVVGTLSTNGLSLGIPAYITTYQNDLTSGRAGTGSGFTGGNSISGSMTVNTNGVSLNLSHPAWITTYVNDLTSGRAGTNGAITGGSLTVNTSGVSINLPAYLTTAAQVSHSHGNPTLNLTNISGTTASASNGLTISLSAAAPGGAGDGVNIVQIGTTGTTGTAWSSTNATVQINGSQNITVSQNNSNQIVVVGPSLTPYQQTSATTAIVSHRAGINGAITGGSLTVNTSGVSINLPAYLTTAAQVGHSHGNPTLNLTNLTGTTASASNGLTLSLSGVAAQTTQTQPAGNIAGVGTTFAGTNVSGSMTFNSNGLNLALSAGAGGAGDGYNIVSVSGNTSGTLATQSTGTIVLAGGNNITLSQNGTRITISAPSGGGIGVSNLGNTLGSTGAVSDRMVFVGGNNITLSQSTNGQSATITISAGAGGGAPNIRWAHSPFVVSNNLITNVTALTQRPIFIPFEVNGNLTADGLMWPMSRATTGSNHFTMHVGLYGYVNGTSISLINSSSASYSATATASVSGVRLFEFPMGVNMSTMTPGQYVMGMIFSATATASMNYSLMGHSTANPVVGGIYAGANTYWNHTSHGQMPMWGRFSTTTGALPANAVAADVIGAITGTSLPLPMAFTIGSDY